MRRRFLLAGAAMLTALALVAPSAAAFIPHASLTIVKNGYKPTWKLTYLLCDADSPARSAEVSEFTYRAGTKNRTLQVWSWGKKALPRPGERGASGRCSWYHSETYRSRFPQRAGYVTGVTLEIFVASGQTITRNFRLHP
jgi:hypothetical protein